MLVEEIGLFRPLSAFGMNKFDIVSFTHEAQNPDMASNPKTMSEQDIAGLYTRLI
jgi:alcohol dehydrogenase class IV